MVDKSIYLKNSMKIIFLPWKLPIRIKIKIICWWWIKNIEIKLKMLGVHWLNSLKIKIWKLKSICRELNNWNKPQHWIRINSIKPLSSLYHYSHNLTLCSKEKNKIKPSMKTTKSSYKHSEHQTLHGNKS